VEFLSKNWLIAPATDLWKRSLRLDPFTDS